MLSQAVLAPPVVLQLPPPYEHFEAVSDPLALTPEDLPDAVLLAIGVASAEEAWPEVATLASQLRARFPASPLILRVGRRADGDGAPGSEVDWLHQAELLRIRAIVPEGEHPGATLRRILTDPTTYPQDLPDWLAVRSPGMPAPVAALVSEIVLLAPRYGEVSALLATLGHAERTVRTWFRRAGVPGPGKWLAVAHAIRAALRMQAEPSAPLLALAVECGYSDHSSLSRQCLRLFGVRPGRIRGLLGWEWLMDRWLRKVSV